MKTKRYRYQIQFACFECRKAFKRPIPVYEKRGSAWVSRGISGREPAKPWKIPDYHCPDGKRTLTLMGKAFRAPRRADLSQWHKAEILARNGFTFWSSVGRYPDTVSEARRFVEAKLKLSRGERLAKQIRKQRHMA